MGIEVVLLDGDRRFRTSPDAGERDCVCSRCGQVIAGEEVAIRAWPAGGGYELRYHVGCVELRVDGGMDLGARLFSWTEEVD